jgi:tetratricopeptide (TPR) repeat protein
LNSWRARVVYYGGADVIGKKMLMNCLQQDPDNVDAQKALKIMKLAVSKKEAASEAFTKGQLDEAIKLFDECVAIDPLNLNYNATLLFNKSVALNK